MKNKYIFIHSPLENSALKGGVEDGSVSTYNKLQFLGRSSRRLILIFFLFIFCNSSVFKAQNASAGESPSSQYAALPEINKDDRILIMAPHPDDEVIGCAGLIQEAVRKKADLRVLYLTNGDHNQAAFVVYEKRLTFRTGEFMHMGRVRRKEAIKAMELLGVPEDKLIFLGYPDFGTFSIFQKYWQGSKPYKSILTRISRVPYKENLSFGAPYVGESILKDLKAVLLAYRPNKVFVSHPIDVNGDHRVFSLFLQVALADLRGILPEVAVYDYLIHWKGWPLPRRYHPELPIFAPSQFKGTQAVWFIHNLSRHDLEKKYKAILCSKSQTQSSAFYLLSFARKNELFGYFPEINLKDGDWESAFGLNAENNLEDDEQDICNVGYSLSEGCLVIRIHNGKKIGRLFSIMTYLFGYNYNTSFAKMPKISIITRYNKYKVFDGRKKINPAGVSLKLTDKELILKIPLSVLGEPEFLLASVKVGVKNACVNSRCFRTINISK